MWRGDALTVSCHSARRPPEATVVEESLDRCRMGQGIPRLRFGSARNDNEDQNRPTFRISAERSYKKYQYSSLELEKALGNYVRLKMGWKVDLDEPEIDIHVNAQRDDVYVYGNVTDGAGGFALRRH